MLQNREETIRNKTLVGDEVERARSSLAGAAADQRAGHHPKDGLLVLPEPFLFPWNKEIRVAERLVLPLHFGDSRSRLTGGLL